LIEYPQSLYLNIQAAFNHYPSEARKKTPGNEYCRKQDQLLPAFCINKKTLKNCFFKVFSMQLEDGRPCKINDEWRHIAT